jgi:hypothetical protein
LGDCLLWAVFLKITEGSTNFWTTFSAEKFMYKFRENMGWATYWAIFSQTHPVTLVGLPKQVQPSGYKLSFRKLSESLVSSEVNI